MKEVELRPIVDLWLQKQGYQVGHELLLSGYCDVVGFIFGKRIDRRIPPLVEVIAIELKINDIAGVISQARSNRYFVDKSFAAMPTERCESMRSGTIKLFKKNKVGLLAIGNTIKIIAPAVRMRRNCLRCEKNSWQRTLQRKLWRINRIPEGANGTFV